MRSESVSGISGITDPDLLAVLSAWQNLPPAARAGILAMIKAMGGESPRSDPAPASPLRRRQTIRPRDDHRHPGNGKRAFAGQGGLTRIGWDGSSTPACRQPRKADRPE